METLNRFVENYYPHYIIDSQNEELFFLIEQYAQRKPEFENPSIGRYLDKGICLTGNVGTGKTEIMRIMNAYMKFIQSPYAFNTGIVWKFAEAYAKVGYGCFNNCSKGNWYFDELALTDEKTGIPVNEITQHYGDKILIGEALIRRRYENFKEDGLQTHWTSNCPPPMLENIYGARAFSRLCEMNNFLSLTGKDRRRSVKPTFKNNKNLIPDEIGSPVTVSEIQANKDKMNKNYAEYLKTGIVWNTAPFDYYAMQLYGCKLPDEAGLQEIQEIVTMRRVVEISQPTNDHKKALRNNQLIKQYNSGEIDKEERAYIWAEVRKEAVLMFLNKQKALNVGNLF